MFISSCLPQTYNLLNSLLFTSVWLDEYFSVILIFIYLIMRLGRLTYLEAFLFPFLQINMFFVYQSFSY